MVTAREILELFTPSGIDVDVSGIAPDDPLDRHGVDSMDLASLMYQIEVRYEVTIHPEEYEGLSSLADFAGLVNRRRGT